MPIPVVILVGLGLNRNLEGYGGFGRMSNGLCGLGFGTGRYGQIRGGRLALLIQHPLAAKNSK
jgi:hypothetical protein